MLSRSWKNLVYFCLSELYSNTFLLGDCGTSVREAVFEEQQRIDTLVNGNLTEEERIKLINDLNGEYPELLKNYDLENLSQEDAIQLQKDIRVELIETAILKQKTLALALAENRILEEQAKINKISNAEIRKQKQAELDFEVKRQLGRIDAIEEETRRRLGLADDIDESNDNSLTNAEDNDVKNLDYLEESLEKNIQLSKEIKSIGNHLNHRLQNYHLFELLFFV